MTTIRICTDLDECGRLWAQLIAPHCLFDLWEVRMCFHRAFEHPLFFVAAEERGIPRGLLALSWLEDAGSYAMFPGEMWHGKTWLEQNKIPVSEPGQISALLGAVPGAALLRYLDAGFVPQEEMDLEEDEVGFLFFPENYAFSYEAYLQAFSGKSRKKLGRELDALASLGLAYRYDCLQDADWVFELNLAAFGADSYFHDDRFRAGFEGLIRWLHDNGLLRVTTVLLGGRVAAVDIGAVWFNTYTLLAGGTSPGFPGVAKLINLHHIERSCRERYRVTDFLCGDFGWKARFHLAPRPLYELRLAEPAHIQTREPREVLAHV